MKTAPFRLLLVCSLGAALTFASAVRAASTPAPKKVLVFTKSSGYEHDAVKVAMRNGQPGYALPVLKELGEKNNIEFTVSKDGSLFTPAYLAQFDAFLFYSTGDLTLAKNTAQAGDGNPPMSPEGKAAFLKAIEMGKGFIGVHSAADTFHSPDGRDDSTPARYITDGDKADPYVRMLGGEFIKHDAQQPTKFIIADAKFPGMSAVPTDFGPEEEWYSLKNFPSDLHVLLVHDTSGMKGPSYARAAYPSTWARMQGKGRVFYTSMGHRIDVWANPVFQSVLVGGLNWALGRVEADVTPNLAQFAPQANALPKFPGPRAAVAPVPGPAPAPAAAK